MNFSKKTRVAYGLNPPKRTRMNEDGVPIREKLPGIRIRRKVIGLDGNSRWLVLADGKSVGSFDDNARPEITDPDNAGPIKRLKEKLAGGMLLFSECPFANGSLEPKKGEKPCKGHDGKGRFWKWENRKKNMLIEEECCEHIKAIAAARQAAHTQKQREFAEQARPEIERLLEAQLHATRNMTPPPKPPTFEGNVKG